MNTSLSLLVHGESKSGKSLMAVSGAVPRLLLDVESAARFLPIRPVEWNPKDPPPKFSGNGQGPDTAVVSVKHYDEVKRTWDWLHSGKHPFRSLSLDSISELQQRYIESVAGRGTMRIDQWGSAIREVGGLVRDLRDLTTHPINPMETVVITAMTREVEGVFRPAVQGQLMSVLPYLLDLIGWLYVETDDNGNEKRMLLTRRRARFVAGERVGGRIPPVIALPVVQGDTPAAMAASNTTIQRLRALVFPESESGTTTPTSTEPKKASAR